MLLLEPISVETIWGSDRLRPFGADPSSQSIGQMYTVAAQESYSNKIVNGDYQGQTLRQVFQDQWSLFGYPKSRTFPLLIGFVDANDDLSIQVHPTDSFARAHEQKEYGKNESWFFLKAPESGVIYDGVRCDSPEEFRQRAEAGTVMEVVDTLAVHPGDYVYVEAGTVHALRSGSLVYEIQQATDLTYRLYDYNRVDSQGRPRPLHLEKALSVADISKKSTAVPMESHREYTEPCYSLQRLSLAGAYTNPLDVFVCVTLLQGELVCGGLPVRQGMSMILFPGETASFTGSAEGMIARPY